jgi:iron complex outermembrane receptor protein
VPLAYRSAIPDFVRATVTARRPATGVWKNGAWERARRGRSIDTYQEQRQLLCALLFGTWLPLVSVQAAESGEVSATAAPVDTIIVTARKREESLAEIPASITVISGDQVRDERLNTLSDLDRLAPNLQFSDANGVRTLYLRGVGGGGRQVGFDTRAGIFVDGVSMSQPPSVNGLLLDVERVEVLRGPQSTLFGQDTESGALSLVTRAPGNVPALDAQLVLGNDGIRQLRGSGDAPLTANLFARASVYATHRDGFVENREDGSQLDETQDAGGRLRVRWLAASELVVDLAADKTRQHSENPLGEARTNTFGDGPPASPSPYTSNLNTPQTDVNDNQGVSATAIYQADDFDVQSISALRTTERHWVADFDHSAQDYLALDYRDRYRTISQELRLTFDGEDQGLLIGAYLFDQRAESERMFAAGTELNSLVLFLSPQDEVTTLPQVDTRSYALFGSYSRALSDRWAADAGLRVTRLFKSLDFSQTATPGFVLFGFANLDDYDDEFSETAWSPEASLRYAITQDSTLFLHYARGFKSGGFDADALARSVGMPRRFRQETVDSVEIGAKTRWLRNRVGADLVLFLADYRDYQLTQFLPVGNIVQPVIANAGKVRTYGPELALYWIASSNLKFSLDAAWLHAEYREFEDANGMGADFSGKRLEFSPKWNGSLGIEYRRPVTMPARTEIFAGLSAAYRDAFFTQASNRPMFEADPRRLLSARLGIASRPGDWEIAIFGDNLLDDRYSESLNLATLGTLYGRYGAPHTFGVQLRVAFRSSADP